MSFSKLKDKLLDDSKTQTIRKPRKTPLKVGDKLYVYWKLRTKGCKKLGEAVVTNIVRKQLRCLTEEEARKDGFLDKAGLLSAFLDMHGYDGMPDKVFDVISFRWTLKLWEALA